MRTTEHVVLIDSATGRPACVLWQAAAGCDHHAISSTISARHWIVEELPETVQRFRATRQQLRALSDALDRKYPERNSASAALRAVVREARS